MTRIPTLPLLRTFSMLFALGALAGCYEVRPVSDPAADCPPASYQQHGELRASYRGVC